MRSVTPEVILVASPRVAHTAIADYIKDVGATDETVSHWMAGDYALQPEGADLIEAGGRLCYRSWEPGLNVNVSKIREDQGEYLANVIASGHGSVLEHANYSFIFVNVSRVFTHELVRHRAGTAISQESMRFVRLTDIPFWMPEWAAADEELYLRNREVLEILEEHQRWMAEHFGLDATKRCGECNGEGRIETTKEGARPPDQFTFMTCNLCKGTGTIPAVPFSEKKAKTSFMRRFAPDGVATALLWTANIRTLRHVITMRTESAAEEEIRLVFDQVAEIMVNEEQALFADFERQEDGAWVPTHRKV